jgi:hypothetical protein
MDTIAIAKRLVELCQSGQNEKAVAELYSPDIVSLEGFEMPGMPREMKGIEQIKGKGEWWANAHEIHSAKILGPWCSMGKFSAYFEYDVTERASGKRHTMKEIGVYTVRDGKIVHEEFLYEM